MSAKSIHFKVSNGDMTLIELESGRRILIDIKIRVAADNQDDETPDVGSQLRERLESLGRDNMGRLYVDAFLQTHPDQDHIGGLRSHFYLGAPSSWNIKEDKIFIREMWSSPIVFRRAERKAGFILCDDALAWRDEARRRVKLFKEKKAIGEFGNMIQILGEDIDGKTDDLTAILVRAGEQVTTIAGIWDQTFSGFLLAPMLADNDAEDEELSKNNSSVIMRMTIQGDGVGTKYLFGGDAEVGIWERLWDHYPHENFEYDILLSPHHCSWHSLSWDSWSKKKTEAKVSAKARNALGQAKTGATILASSVSIKDDDNDPPCIRAKREYLDILQHIGEFRCIADEAGDDPFELILDSFGHRASRRRLTAGVAGAGAGTYATGVGATALGHG